MECAMATATTPEGVIEVDGKLWKLRRNATASAAEFIAARSAFREMGLLHDQVTVSVTRPDWPVGS
jgi:hypothetical protein